MSETATLQIAMPEMGESVTEGIVLEWHVAEGDFVREGDTVVEVSTDKVDAEVPAPVDGTITKLLVAVDDEVPVGAPMVEMEPGEGPADSAAGPVAGEGGALRADAERPSSTPPTPAPPAGEKVGGLGRTNGADGVRATPVARRMAEETGVDLRSVAGSGHGAKVLKEDVVAAANGEVRPAGEAKALRGPAAMLAEAMDESREVPTATSFRAVAVDTLDA
jgi:2-oxoglutarate decarboxylase